MGGLGKTTFARKVYKEVRSHFEASAWVCLSQKFALLEVLQNTLKGLVKDPTPAEIMAMDIEPLREKLHEVLTEKKCLVVLDDIWSIKHWKDLEGAFPYEKEVSGTKILLTTSIQEVAELDLDYKLEGLTVDEGWKLLSKKAFTLDNNRYAEDRVDPYKERIGRQIVEKCRGLPSAIFALGGLLKRKTLHEWFLIKQDISDSLKKAGDSDEYSRVGRILDRSYDDLTSHQKQLLLYLGNYGEDEEIHTLKLYQLWIAEGMVLSSDVNEAKGKMLMDVAESYLTKLAEMSLVQVTPADYGQPMKYSRCRLHDLVRDFCLKKGKVEHVCNFSDIPDAKSESLDFQAKLGKLLEVAHYVFDGSGSRVPLNKNDFGQLRSLAFYRPDELPQIVQNLQQLQLVRVLRLEKFEFKEGKLPQELSDLIHLRLLSLFGCTLNELASFIGDFRYLETLDLRVNSKCVTIANVLRKLKRLKHLYLPAAYSGKLKFDGLDELEILYNCRVSSCEIDDLVILERLQVIEDIRVESAQQLEEALNVIASKRFTSLYVYNVDLLSSSECSGREVSSSNYLTQLLEANGLNHLKIGRDVGGGIPTEINSHNFSASLVNITLEGCNYEDDPMPLLEKLPNLRVLVLGPYSYVGTHIFCSAMGFPRLTTLFLFMLPDLETWRLDKEAMPNLFRLRIRACQELDMLPDGLEFLKSLGEIEVDFMSEAFKERITGEDFHKVSHVPSITVNGEKIGCNF